MAINNINLWSDCIRCDTDTQKINHLANLVINKKSDKDFYSSKEVCKMLKITSNTLDNYCSQGLIAYSKPQRKRYFFKEDINDFLIKYRVISKRLIKND